MKLDHAPGRDQRFLFQSRDISGAATDFLYLEGPKMLERELFIFRDRLPNDLCSLFQKACRFFPAYMQPFSESQDEIARIQRNDVKRLIKTAIIRKKKEICKFYLCTLRTNSSTSGTPPWYIR